MIDGQLDKVDLRILDILQEDAGIDISRLSEMVHRSRTATYDRVRKLKTAGFIRGLVAVLDRDRVGVPVLVVVHIKLERQNHTVMRHYTDTFSKFPEVQSCFQVSGNWDFILQVAATTPQEYYSFLMTHICDQPNVAQVNSSFVMAECKGYGALPLLELVGYKAN